MANLKQCSALLSPSGVVPDVLQEVNSNPMSKPQYTDCMCPCAANETGSGYLKKTAWGCLKYSYRPQVTTGLLMRPNDMRWWSKEVADKIAG